MAPGSDHPELTTPAEPQCNAGDSDVQPFAIVRPSKSMRKEKGTKQSLRPLKAATAEFGHTCMSAVAELASTATSAGTASDCCECCE